MTEKQKTKSKKATQSKTGSKSRTTAKEKSLLKTIAELETRIEELESQLDDQQERTQNAEEKMLRVVAEYENGKKRVEREKERSLTFAKERVLTGLFPIIDNLERSAQFEVENKTDQAKQQGLHLVLDQIRKFLKETDNVESFDPHGETFDPELHDAMAMQPAEDVESGKIIEVFEKGYRSGDRILRAAKVIVSQ